MLQPWVKWCINHNLKILVYFIWFIILPVFIFAYFQQAAEDALYEFNYIKNTKKDNL